MISSRHSTVALGTAALSLAIGCHLERPAPVLTHELNVAYAADENPALLEDEAALGQLAGALELLYGTASRPRYLMVEAWQDDEYDPNAGSFELTEDQFEALKASNQEHFEEQIAFVRRPEAKVAADFEGMPRPRYADDLWRTWRRLLDDMPEEGADGVLFESEDGEPITWRSEAEYVFTSYYPTLATSAELYRQQCSHCHGPSGGGNGSTAPYLNPPPRDYRRGIFKFTALKDKAKPRQEDLFRVLAEGIYTTSMPSFRRFSDAHLWGLADYVRLLAKRGETELFLIDEYDADDGFPSLETVKENYVFADEKWRGTDDSLIVYEGEIPRPTPESIERGRKHFLNAQGANCVSCHGAMGLGDGTSAKEPNPEAPDDPEARLWVKDDWGNEIRPRNLTRNVYRFGRRPIDVYRRIYAGINGTPMPAHFGMTTTDEDGTQRKLTEDDLWDIVHYVRSLPRYHEQLEVDANAAAVAAAGAAGDDSEGGH